MLQIRASDALKAADKEKADKELKSNHEGKKKRGIKGTKWGKNTAKRGENTEDDFTNQHSLYLCH